MDKLEQVLDKNLELTRKLEEKLDQFAGYLKGVTVGMSVIALIQFTLILWLVLR
jgi:hypothetical protein